MSDPTILYGGVFCFAMTLLGLALTIYEFRKVSRVRDRSNQDAEEKPAPVKAEGFAAGSRA